MWKEKDLKSQLWPAPLFWCTWGILKSKRQITMIITQLNKRILWSYLSMFSKGIIYLIYHPLYSIGYTVGILSRRFHISIHVKNSFDKPECRSNFINLVSAYTLNWENSKKWSDWRKKWSRKRVHLPPKKSSWNGSV